MTKTASETICEGYEPIPGYVVEEMIGQGGFGEVWRAGAPGGLKKAVKFVFGDQGSERSRRELKSLERIRGVQHPFLLTLERFEAVNNRLVIVTELADGSLEDVYHKYRDQGSCGIPTDELLRHLHDAADALDYLHNSYQLQHLDVKPGNLLMIGGHVKVADFGLLKDLQEADCSVVGGLTPVYAPPELFDGRPSVHSDQYSLAVMYQELLTGKRPFHGRTIAQLATQHVHATPNLQPLPARDRPAVARALEKDPKRRFESCLAFVDALRHSRAGKRSRVQATGLGSKPVNAEAFDHVGSVEDLPQLQSSDSANRDRSTPTAHEFALVVGLGGTGAACVRELRRRVGKNTASRLELHSAIIDTDLATVDSVADPELDRRAGPCEQIYTPLKTAQAYRSAGTDRLRTISRRWIYNVPRSATTEGMRPLGRLALVDHGKEVTSQLKTAIARLVDRCGDITPRVYLAGSLTGGSSSGMYLDVVYLLRHLLDRAALEDVDILSLVTTTPMQADPGYPLALHDAHAALIEMNHFLGAANGYPGDPGAGWPSVPAARTPLKNVYLISEPAAGSLSPSPVETIADYVWSDSTGAGHLLASARSPDVENESSFTGPTLHSVGVVPFSDEVGIQEKVLAPAVVRELLVNWLGLPADARQAAVRLRGNLIRRMGIAPTAMVTTVAKQLVEPSLRQQLSNIDPIPTGSQDDDWQSWAAKVDPIAKLISESGTCRSHCSESMKKFFAHVSTAFTDGYADVTTVIECMKLIRHANQEAILKLRSNRLASMNHADEYSVCRLVAPLVGAHNLEHINECFDFLAQRLDRFATTLAMGIVQAKKLQGGESNPWESMPPLRTQQFGPTVKRLHGAMVGQFLVRTLVDHTAKIDAGAMVNHLQDAASALVKDVIGKPPAEGRAADLNDDDGRIQSGTHVVPSMRRQDGISETSIPERDQMARALGSGAVRLTVDQALVAVKPSLLEFGGQQRLILIVGNEGERQHLEPQVRAAHDGSLTVFVVPDAAPRLVHEACRVEISNLLSRLTVLNGDNAEITRRLSSRSDISW